MVIGISIAVICAGCFALGFFCAMKAVQMGLKWKIQAENQAPPTTPAQDIQTGKDTAKAVLSNETILKEWLNGPQPQKKDDDE